MGAAAIEAGCPGVASARQRSSSRFLARVLPGAKPAPFPGFIQLGARHATDECPRRSLALFVMMERARKRRAISAMLAARCCMVPKKRRSLLPGCTTTMSVPFGTKAARLAVLTARPIAIFRPLSCLCFACRLRLRHGQDRALNFRLDPGILVHGDMRNP